MGGGRSSIENQRSKNQSGSHVRMKKGRKMQQRNAACYLENLDFEFVESSRFNFIGRVEIKDRKGGEGSLYIQTRDERSRYESRDKVLPVNRVEIERKRV